LFFSSWIFLGTIRPDQNNSKWFYSVIG
jgi:hypothetical protein